MSSMPWVKLYTEMLDDPKIGRLPDAIKWRFVSLVLLAGECDNDGALQHGDGRPMTEADIAWRLRIDELRCTEELEALLQCGVVELDADVYYLPKFSDRQGRPQSEKRAQWRERQARYRDTHETKESVTRDSRVNNASRVEKSREEKRREDSADKPRRPAKKPETPPQIAAYHEVAHRYPNKSLYDDITSAVPESDIDFYKKVLKAWIGLGWNPSNIAGQLEAYKRREIPHKNGQSNGNGSTPQPAPIAPDREAALARAFR